MVSILGKLTYLPVLSQVFDRAIDIIAAGRGGAAGGRPLYRIHSTL
jgi:hypothetical protein